MAFSRPLAVLAFFCFAWNSLSAQSDAAASPSQKTEIPTIRTTVRRVIVDVVVRDSNNQPVHGLTDHDFEVTEDGVPQTILTFDVHNLDTPSISLPANGPHLSTNNFVDIPPTPERGPLYVLLYDLVNTEADDQIDARRQLLKFIKNKPAGTRFALFVRSDDLALVQGFTEDKELLYTALDPNHPRPHVPRVFLMGKNYGYGDPVSVMNVLTQVTEFLEGIPGHKNLIWLAGTFPLALVPRREDPREYEDDIKAEVNVLTRAEVSVYPINVSGVPVNPPGQLTGARMHGGNANQTVASGGQITGGGAGLNSLSSPDATGTIAAMRAEGSGDSAITDYAVQRSIAEATGGRAYYSTNDVAGALEEATEVDGNYYSLTYSPTNKNDDGKRRSIRLNLDQKGYHLAYRRFYFTGAYSDQPQLSKDQPKAGSQGAPAATDIGALQPAMRHGAPMIHELIFAAHFHTEGNPARATPEQMARLADEPAYFRTHHTNKPQKALTPVDLQTYAIDYRVQNSPSTPSAPQGGKPPAFEFAAAAFDADGHMLNGIENDATGKENGAGQDTTKSGLFRVRQQLDVPVNAAWIRIGVRDKLTNHIGTLEVQLPLAPEPVK